MTTFDAAENLRRECRGVRDDMVSVLGIPRLLDSIVKREYDYCLRWSLRLIALIVCVEIAAAIVLEW